jgi:dolichol-phosphate mannosyltransferase
VISIITPAFNEAAILPALYARIVQTMAGLGLEWEWLVIDDHSRDETFAVLQQLSGADSRVRGIRFARNAGSHVAIACGLRHARGAAAAMLAADLQDPPETLAAMIERWRGGAQVVWAVRRRRPGDRAHSTFAALYYWTMRHVVGLREMPSRGADFFLADRAVVEAFRRFPERTSSVFALLTSVGFRQEYVEYDKQPRAAGRSGWTLARKIRLVVDSVVAFSNAPIRWCAYGGASLFVASLVILIGGVARLPDLGGGLLILLAAVVGLSAVQLLALAMVGEYVSRTLDEARRRPEYLIEAETSPAAAP